jgi:uncharacterized protein YegJ (DUF2314 family)
MPDSAQMAVQEHAALDDGTYENDIYYDVVNNDIGNVEDTPAVEAAVLQFVQTEEHDVNDWLLQVEFLESMYMMLHCPVHWSESRFFHN